ncbi:glycosyltransferase family 2 protein [Mucilaginibacter flavidus]|uniref:glycosyltransferase family 2 protein n=1 Tax=Mucilaginibacter flavidus TaxID=2949309 RepID=UPI002092EF0D|nr:glycosyltransferase family 2 protein [Mucilaginibacter flavidus]MCO5948252.1 glycosyltransferase family 2 protein [Mucilaginibacter flavidus]
MALLSILLPTFNRDEFLLKNLHILYGIIKKADFLDNVDIIISNNCSTDNTKNIVRNFNDTHDITIHVFDQPVNIGLKANALFVLSKSEAEYVMYLGDDDYISYEYFIECIDILRKDKATYAIVPNYFPVSVADEVLGDPRDKMEVTCFYNPGFSAVVSNSYRGHQLSGIVLKREGLLDSYLMHKVDNIYLFIYMIGIWCLKGNVYRISSSPTRVTQPEKKKDWGYGNDGLMNEIFDNYKRLPVNYFKRYLLESKFFIVSYWRFTMYRQLGIKPFARAYINIAFAKNATTLFSISFFPLLLAGFLRKKYLN